MKSPPLSRRFTAAHKELLPAVAAGWGLKGVPPFARRLYYTSQKFVYIVVVPIEIIKHQKQPQKDSN